MHSSVARRERWFQLLCQWNLTLFDSVYPNTLIQYCTLSIVTGSVLTQSDFKIHLKVQFTFKLYVKCLDV